MQLGIYEGGGKSQQIERIKQIYNHQVTKKKRPKKGFLGVFVPWWFNS